MVILLSHEFRQIHKFHAHRLHFGNRLLYYLERLFSRAPYADRFVLLQRDLRQADEPRAYVGPLVVLYVKEKTVPPDKTYPDLVCDLRLPCKGGTETWILNGVAVFLTDLE